MTDSLDCQSAKFPVRRLGVHENWGCAELSLRGVEEQCHGQVVLLTGGFRVTGFSQFAFAVGKPGGSCEERTFPRVERDRLGEGEL
jgi:hypothetical protein